ncbi:hypothetical protein JOF53_002510 [Crossiella equi]|uniref:Uncharacterized protein n=1 Tax=Crossiella equi TaxID=130796 RepID=A0ABS5AAM9_9PSEU|nr:hypothetical protein [Crossiella equi]MBP2473638.1 hypothetical protein [Crossiella equi]
MPRRPARQSPGCAVVLVLLLGAPAAYLVWAALSPGDTGTRMWQAVGAGALLLGVVAGLLVVLDVGDAKRPGYSWGCLLLGLPVLVLPGVLLGLLGSGGIAATGWVLTGLGVLTALATLNKGPDRGRPAGDGEEPEEPSANGQVSALAEEPAGAGAPLANGRARPGLREAASQPAPASRRIGCSLAVLGLVALPAASMLWIAAFDATRTDGGRVWLAVGGGLVFALATLLTAAAAGLGESPTRVDLGCLGSFLVLLAAPGAFLLIAKQPPGGVRVVGWCLLGLAALAVVVSLFRNRGGK